VRISRQQMFMEMAHVAAKRSTCFRLNVGAIIVYQNRNLVGLGYNGAPSGHPHCQGNSCPGRFGCQETTHAEVNALDQVRNLSGKLDLYVTDSPCDDCCAAIIKHGGVRRVFFDREYRITTGLSALRRHNVEVFKCTAAGYLVDWDNKEIVTITSGGLVAR
jgi:dCMP deaminase